MEVQEILSALQTFFKENLLPVAKHDKTLAYQAIITSNLIGIAIRELQAIKSNEVHADRKPSLLEIIDAIHLFIQEELLHLYQGEAFHIPDWSKQIAKYINEEQGNIPRLQQDTILKIEQTKKHINDPKLWEQVKQSIEKELQINNPKLLSSA